MLNNSTMKSVATQMSIVVPAHQMNANFARCLAALEQLSPKPLEIIVVADGGDSAVCHAARTSGARVLTTETCKGPGAARNLGVRAAQGDIVFFVDSDVTVPPDVLLHLQEVFLSQDPPDAVIGSYDDQPVASGFLSHYKNLLQHYVHQQGRKDAYTFWGACGAINRQLFLKLNGFDERYTLPSIEDIELGYRLKDNGYSIRLLKHLQIVHLKKWTVRSLFVSDFFRRAIPWSRLILASGQMKNDLNIDRATRIKVVLLYLLISTLLAGSVFPMAFLGSVVIAGSLLVSDWSLFRFFYNKRGPLFTLAVPLWHWFYYGYSGLAFALCMAERQLGRIPDRTAQGWPDHWNRVL